VNAMDVMMAFIKEGGYLYGFDPIKQNHIFILKSINVSSLCISRIVGGFSVLCFYCVMMSVLVFGNNRIFWGKYIDHHPPS